MNIGSDRLITINQLVDIVSGLAGKKLNKVYDKAKPQGVRGRNSDNTLSRKVLNWEPKVSLEEGLRRTYEWIKEEVLKKQQVPT